MLALKTICYCMRHHYNKPICGLIPVQPQHNVQFIKHVYHQQQANVFFLLPFPPPVMTGAL